MDYYPPLKVGVLQLKHSPLQQALKQISLNKSGQSICSVGCKNSFILTLDRNKYATGYDVSVASISLKLRVMAQRQPLEKARVHKEDPKF